VFRTLDAHVVASRPEGRPICITLMEMWHIELHFGGVTALSDIHSGIRMNGIGAITDPSRAVPRAAR
jgi:hypothetical protein